MTPRTFAPKESWLGGGIVDQELSVPNYQLIRLDRNRHGGGLAMFISNKLYYNVIL